jgi:hypothetical protein
MSTTDTCAHGEAIRRSIARRAGPHADARATALATRAIWRRVEAQLEPVIGARGVDALLGRALHLTGKAHPWLAAAGVRGSSDASLDHVQHRLAAQRVELAGAAAQALLTAFADLLTTLVGDSLASRLLDPAWDAPQPDSRQEHAP